MRQESIGVGRLHLRLSFRLGHVLIPLGESLVAAESAKGTAMLGCDLHARQQTIAMLDTTTGEVSTLTLMHEGNQVREFYSQLSLSATV